MIKFNAYHVTNGTTKARVSYSLDGRTDGRACVTLYEAEYGYALRQIIPDGYRNDTDTMTDYFDKGRAVLFADHPLYAAARAKAEEVNAKRNARWAAKRAEAIATLTARQVCRNGLVLSAAA